LSWEFFKNNTKLTCEACFQERKKREYEKSLIVKKEKIKNFKNLKKLINPKTGKPYARGEKYKNKYVFGHVSISKTPIGWDKPHQKLALYDFEEYINQWCYSHINRRDAKHRKGEMPKHNLTHQHLVQIFPRNMICPIFGIELTLLSHKENSIELDKIDANDIYKDGNVMFISSRANNLKNNASSKELFIIADWLKSKGL